jgi:hypothetical protein
MISGKAAGHESIADTLGQVVLNYTLTTHFIFVVLGIKPRALSVLSKHPTTELYPQPQLHIIKAQRT